MARRSARARELEDPTVSQPDDQSIIKSDDDIKGLDQERKDQYLERIKKEDKAHQAAFEKALDWLEVMQNKVLRRSRSKAGSLYTFYWFNRKKHPIMAHRMLEQGGLEYGDPEDPSSLRFIPLKVIDGRPFTKKK